MAAITGCNKVEKRPCRNSITKTLFHLDGFIEELTMLIYNIEGNNNYGEAFSSAVELAFEEVLKSTI